MAPKNVTARSFVEAATEKYGMGSDELMQITGFTIVAPPRVRQEANGNLVLPVNTVATEEDITHAGEEEELRTMCANIRELDLFKNSLKEWSEVFKITDNIQHLRQLNLSKNLLKYSALPGVNPMRFPALHTLILNHSSLSWPCVQQILLSAPSLGELHLSFNNFHCVELSEDFQHQGVTNLSFTGNPLADPAHMLRLGYAFPNLTHLFMMESQLRQLSSETELGMAFPCLTFLSLCMTELQGWGEVDKLDALPSLQDVRLQGIPFLELLPDEFRRNLIIVHLPRITRLNSSSIDTESRSDAEWSYLRFHREDAVKPPLYEKLVAKHGEPSELAQVSLKPQTEFDVKVEVEGQEGEHVLHLNILQVPTVRHLKKHLVDSGLVGFPASRMRLYYQNVIDQFGADELKIPSRSLQRMHISDGDKFFVNFKHQ